MMVAIRIFNLDGAAAPVVDDGIALATIEVFLGALVDDEFTFVVDEARRSVAAAVNSFG